MNRTNNLVTSIIFAVKVGLIGMTSISCGDNVFESSNAIDVTEKASKLLEKNKSDEAIKIILKELGSNFRNAYALAKLTDINGNYSYSTAELSFALRDEADALITAEEGDVPALISILSAAHSQKYGIDPFAIALAIATDSGSDSDSDSNEKSPVTSLYGVLPDATKENKRGLNEAIAILNAIDPNYLSPADYFKLSLLLVSNISLITKTLDTSPVDGNISQNELLNLEEDDAFALLELVALAALAVINSGESNDPDESTAGAKSAETVVKLKEQLDSIEGDDDPEKAQVFIQKITGSSAR